MLTPNLDRLAAEGMLFNNAYLHVCSTLLHGPNGEWHRSLMNKELVTGEGILEKPIRSQPSRASVMQRIKAAGLTENEAGYLWMDDSIGVILDKLDELGIADKHHLPLCFRSRITRQGLALSHQRHGGPVHHPVAEWHQGRNGL